MPSLTDKPEVEIIDLLPAHTLWAANLKDLRDLTGCDTAVSSSGPTGYVQLVIEQGILVQTQTFSCPRP